MSEERITVTEGLKKLIVDARKRNNLTATDISNKIKNTDYWLQNIESGRTKTVTKADLIEIIKLCNNCTSVEAESIIAETLNSTISNQKSCLNQEDELRLYREDTDTLEDVSKYRNEFEKILADTRGGFELFFERVDNKEIAVKLLRRINSNLHSDLGFILSLFSLNWCMISNNSVDEKKKIIKELSALIKENGSCEQCKTDKEKKDSGC